MLIKTVSGFELGGAASAPSMQDGLDFVEAESLYDIEFRFQCLLAPGTYFLNAGVVGIVDDAEDYLDRILDVEMFRVTPTEKHISTGIVDFRIVPSIRKQHTATARSSRQSFKG